MPQEVYSFGAMNSCDYHAAPRVRFQTKKTSSQVWVFDIGLNLHDALVGNLSNLRDASLAFNFEFVKHLLVQPAFFLVYGPGKLRHQLEMHWTNGVMVQTSSSL